MVGGSYHGMWELTIKDIMADITADISLTYYTNTTQDQNPRLNTDK